MTTPTLEQSYDMKAIASRVMYELLGRRWVWPRMRAIDAYPANTVINLTGRPVSEIISVTGPNGSVLAPEDYELFGKFRLRLPYWIGRNVVCNGVQPEVTVEYIYGTPPPAQVAYAIDVLARQLELAATGNSECKLPQRITSISRQGVNLTLLDPLDYLEKGRIGLPEVDSVLMIFNRGRAKARSRVFTQENPPARRLSVVAVDEDTVLFIEQGSDWAATWPVYDDDDNPLDVTTGWQVDAQVKSSAESATVLYEWSDANSNVEYGDGFIKLLVPAADSSAWSWRKAVFDMELTGPGGTVTRIDEGRIIVDPEVTT